MELDEEKLKKQTKEIDYKSLFHIRKSIENEIKKICPNMDNKSGIYFYTRIDEDGSKQVYIGKAVNLINRTVSHIQYINQHIDASIKKRGFYSINNPYGWKLNFLHFPVNELDEREKYYIMKYKNAGYVLYNIESGGVSDKIDLQKRKSTKTYTEGIANGKKKTKEQIKEYFDKYLDISIKPPTNKIKERKLVEFLKNFCNDNN